MKKDEERYDKVHFRTLKGEMEKVKIYAAGNGETINEFLNRLISYHVPDFHPIGKRGERKNK